MSVKSVAYISQLGLGNWYDEGLSVRKIPECLHFEFWSGILKSKAKIESLTCVFDRWTERTKLDGFSLIEMTGPWSAIT